MSFVYGQRHPVVALDDVSLRIGSAEVVALLGPNGSGKSTLLRALSGAVRPSRGEILLHGQDVHRMGARERARRVAFVPQQVRVDFPFTVGEVVMMGRAPYQGRFGIEHERDEAIVDEAMERMRVKHLRGRRMNAVSGGEAQRVMLAQALSQQPDVLLLDEPTSHLDINFQAEIMDLLASLNEERGLTVLLSLHDLNLAGLYSHRVVLLRAGRVYAEGRPADVLTEASVREVFGAHVRVGRHPADDAPLVTLVPRRLGAPQKEDGPRTGANF